MNLEISKTLDKIFSNLPTIVAVLGIVAFAIFIVISSSSVIKENNLRHLNHCKNSFIVDEFIQKHPNSTVRVLETGYFSGKYICRVTTSEGKTIDLPY